MILDENYSHIKVCPETGIQLTPNQVNYRNGVCPKCGHDESGTITHHNVIVGKWDRPSFFERVFQGKKIEFIPKEHKEKDIPF